MNGCAISVGHWNPFLLGCKRLRYTRAQETSRKQWNKNGREMDEPKGPEQYRVMKLEPLEKIKGQ